LQREILVDENLWMDIRTRPISQNATNAFSPMNGADANIELEGLQRLDSQAISAIYDRYFPDVYRFVYYRLNDEQAAEDIASDVFVRLLDAVQKQSGPQSNLKGWLLATASHIVSDHYRLSYRRPTAALPETLPDGGASLTEEIDHRERVAAVRTAYERLTEDQQNVLALRFGDGYSLDETATAMQKNVNAVKALQFRALAALQRLIGEVNHE
jgi:RNA polymerase sigma-70 factor (ECF subfamily)